MKRRLLFVVLFFSIFTLLSAHDDNSTKLTLKPCYLVEEWQNIQDSEERFELFLSILDNYEVASFPIWEYKDQDERIISELRNECINKNDDRIKSLLIEHTTLEKNLSDYKNSKLVNIVTILILILTLFFCASIYFALNFFDSYKREKSTKSINKHIIQIQEAERTRLSHELHDTVAQDLKGISLISNSKEIDELTKNAITDIRNICYNLTPPELEFNKLSDAIAIITENFRKASGIETPLVITNPEFLDSFSQEKQLNIFRIIQESLENIKIHSKASEASIVIRKKGKLLTILICDDGIGFDPSKSVSNNNFGLRNIKERTDSLNGKFELKTKIGFGTEIMLTIPGEN